MLRNYLLVALRNLARNKSYIIINTLGIGIALACCITAYLLVAYNIEFDSFHSDEKTSDIYRVHAQLRKADGTPYYHDGAPINLAMNAANDFSGITRYTRYNNTRGLVRTEDDTFDERISFADSTFFEMFDFPLIHGSHASFKDLQAVVLSKEMAEKLFRDENPIGEVLTLNCPNQTEIKVVVGGVMEQIPLNNSFVFDVMVRIEHFMDIYNLGSVSFCQNCKIPFLYLNVKLYDTCSFFGD